MGNKDKKIGLIISILVFVVLIGVAAYGYFSASETIDEGAVVDIQTAAIKSY